MRHAKAGVKLNRTTSHRTAMFRNMVTSLLKHNKIRTTDAKAKELRRWADKIITLAKRGDLHARRQALSIVREKDVVHKLFEDAEERFGEISGGYTRIVKLGYRPGDAAKMSMIEVLDMDGREGKKKQKPSHYESAAPVDAKPDEAEAAPEADAVDASDADTVEVDAAAETEPEAEAAAEPEETPEPEAETGADEAEAAPEEPVAADEEKPAEEEEAPKKDAPEAGEKTS